MPLSLVGKNILFLLLGFSGEPGEPYMSFTFVPSSPSKLCGGRGTEIHGSTQASPVGKWCQRIPEKTCSDSEHCTLCKNQRAVSTLRLFQLDSLLDLPATRRTICSLLRPLLGLWGCNGLSIRRRRVFCALITGRALRASNCRGMGAQQSIKPNHVDTFQSIHIPPRKAGIPR